MVLWCSHSTPPAAATASLALGLPTASLALGLPTASLAPGCPRVVEDLLVFHLVSRDDPSNGDASFFNVMNLN